jgi:hypothetical protein
VQCDVRFIAHDVESLDLRLNRLRVRESFSILQHAMLFKDVSTESIVAATASPAYALPCRHDVAAESRLGNQSALAGRRAL